MIGAGLVAKKAAAKGLKAKPWVKTSLAPGSKVVTDYLVKAGLQSSLDALGFNLVGYGCTTCIGNSGPLDDAIVKAMETTIQQKRVTYDFERLMDDETLLKCSEFGDALIENMG